MNIYDAIYSIGYLDSLSYRESPVHNLDSRVKIITSMIYIFLVVSIPSHKVSALLPFFSYPVFLMAAGGIPAGFIVRKVVLVSPFVLMVAVFNPLFDQRPVIELFGIVISAGWVSFASIIIKFLLTISVALLMIATTSFAGVCQGLSAMRLPRVFVIQLMLLYRYIFVIIEEALRMVRARDSRAPVKRAKRMGVFIQLIGVLLVRTISRAERVYGAMLSRGFRGEFPAGRIHRLTHGDILFLIVWVIAFVIMRLYNIPVILGGFLR